ncbi:polyphosphate polymerase domain-containing protein [Corynebacterium crudilactis]|uniref:Vacuolar transporter n=1 Tax=Corynebacterium crudilactis TaxID=1652495 RepID=A0A172QQ80_9CORY|nr:vacuolar transporter [Corynebacterium crudilactis]
MLIGMTNQTVNQAVWSGVKASPHRFNRFEIKYLIPEQDVPALREQLATRMSTDPLSPPGGYRVESLYFDSADLRCYTEKIEGLKFRRKLRIRTYGDGVLTPESTVSVEIKQRVNKVTQKRRLDLPFIYALALGDSTGAAVGEQVDVEKLLEISPENQHALIHEMASFAKNYRLRPIATTKYHREAFVGADAEASSRVTIDHGVSGRDRDFLLGQELEDRPTVAQGLAVVEIKCDERVPFWLTDMTAQLEMSVIRMSKYCETIEAFHNRPASAFGAVDPIF